MEVTSADRVRPGRGRAARYVAVGGLCSALLVLPAVAVDAYATAVTAALLVSVFLAATRLCWSAVRGRHGRTTPGWTPARAREPAGGDDAAAHGRRVTAASAGDPPTVSVVVTAYDEADVLPGTVAALRNLAYPVEALEVLLCYEAASTDGTMRIAREAATAHEFVRALAHPEPPAGKAAITNLGVAAASGDVVAVLDADQRLESDAVRRAVRWFETDEAVWCVTGRRYGRNPTASLVALHATVEHHVAERLEFVARDAGGGFTLFTGGQAFFRREVFDRVGPFAEDVLLEDVDMACRIHAAGGQIRVDPGVVSTEVNPETLGALWHQRVRWARGGLQAARRHLASLATDGSVDARTRLGAVATFVPLVAVPPLALASPVAVLAAAGVVPAAGVPAASVPVVGAGVVLAALVPAVVFLLDAREGRTHAPAEYLVPASLPAYALLQALALTVAFVDEVVLGRRPVYVTT
jgi:hypothetical protein